MGPLLMHNKTIKIMDSVIKSTAQNRYQNDIPIRSNDLKLYYQDQIDLYTNDRGTDKL